MVCDGTYALLLERRPARRATDHACRARLSCAPFACIAGCLSGRISGRSPSMSVFVPLYFQLGERKVLLYFWDMAKNIQVGKICISMGKYLRYVGAYSCLHLSCYRLFLGVLDRAWRMDLQHDFQSRKRSVKFLNDGRSRKDESLPLLSLDNTPCCVSNVYLDALVNFEAPVHS